MFSKFLGKVIGKVIDLLMLMQSTILITAFIRCYGFWLRLVKPTKRYLSKRLAKQEFTTLGSCLKKLSLDYRDLFWFMDDLKVHNQMEFWAEQKGCPSKDIFSKKEKEIILKAENLLNIAPVLIHEELKVFCHF